jgi:hypothetical protein
MTELENELFDIFCKDWPRQVRELTSSKILVRFPPHRRVAYIKKSTILQLEKRGGAGGGYGVD